jgi:hypothetical protein
MQHNVYAYLYKLSIYIFTFIMFAARSFCGYVQVDVSGSGEKAIR